MLYFSDYDVKSTNLKPFKILTWLIYGVIGVYNVLLERRTSSFLSKLWVEIRIIANLSIWRDLKFLILHFIVLFLGLLCAFILQFQQSVISHPPLPQKIQIFNTCDLLCEELTKWIFIFILNCKLRNMMLYLLKHNFKWRRHIKLIIYEFCSQQTYCQQNVNILFLDFNNILYIDHKNLKQFYTLLLQMKK